MAEDYRPELKVIRGLSIANMVLSIISIAVVLVGFIVCGASLVAGGAALSALPSSSSSISHPYGVIGGHQTAMTVASDPWSDGYSSSSQEDIDDALEYLLGENGSSYSSNGMTSDEAAALGIMSVALLAFALVVLILSLALSVYMLILSIMILKAKDDISHYKRFFIMSIVAASLSLLLGSLASMTLFILTAVWIQKVRKKAGQLPA